MSRALWRLLRRPLTLGLLAVALLAAGLTIWRQWPRQFLRQGEAALTAREYDKAHAHLVRYLASRPGDAHAQLLAARAARCLREYYQAYEHLRRCREGGGDAEAVEVETALIAVQRGDEPGPELRRRAEQGDDLAAAILEVVIQHDLDTYRLRQALHALNLYLGIRPDDLQALLARGYVWERFLYFADALVDYQKAVEAHPESEPARLKLAETLLIAGTPNEALEQYEWLVGRRPEQPGVQLGLARCRRRLGQDELARQTLDALLATASENGEALWERGQLELDRGKAAAAEGWLRSATRARPHDRRIAHSLSLCLLALGRRAEAEKVQARVAELDTDLRRLGQVRQAVMDHPDDPALRCEGGLLFLRNGEREEGVRWLRLALRLDPHCQAARDALGKAEGPHR